MPDSAKHVRKEYIDGAECHILAFETEEGKCVDIWVDPEKMFCIRRFEIRNTPESEGVETLGTFKEFQLFGDIWYPTAIQYTPDPKRGGMLRSYGFQIIAAEFNVSFPKTFFKIDGDFYLQ